MTFVVTEACIKCKYTDCVDVCPVDAFREGRNMLVIDPDDCIDCAVCVPECPVDAIFAEEDVPADQQDFMPLNAELARRWPTITRTKLPLPDAEDWSKVKDKRAELDRSDPRQPRPDVPGAPDTPDAQHTPDVPDAPERPERP